MQTITTVTSASRNLASAVNLGGAGLAAWTLTEPVHAAQLELLFPSGAAGNLRFYAADSAGIVKYGVDTPAATAAAGQTLVVQLSLPASGSVRCKSDNAADSAVTCSGTLRDVTPVAALKSLGYTAARAVHLDLLADETVGLATLAGGVEDALANSTSAAVDAALVLTTAPIGPPKSPAGDRVAWWSQRSGTHYLAYGGATFFVAAGTFTASDRHVLHTDLAALPDGVVPLTVFRRAGVSPVPASDTPLGVIVLLKTGATITETLFIDSDLTRVASGVNNLAPTGSAATGSLKDLVAARATPAQVTTLIAEAQLPNADFVSAKFSDTAAAIAAAGISAPERAKIATLPTTGAVARVSDLAGVVATAGGGPVQTQEASPPHTVRAGRWRGGYSVDRRLRVRRGEQLIAAVDCRDLLPRGSRLAGMALPVSSLPAAVAVSTLANSHGVDRDLAAWRIEVAANATVGAVASHAVSLTLPGGQLANLAVEFEVIP
ncbi:MAG: hypothetical protein ACRCT8_12060 [Lacipirellulaceae bacterium]